MPSPEERLAQLEAEEAIRNLLFRYLRAYDARDLTALAEAFEPERREAAMDALLQRMPPGRTFHLASEPVLTHVSEDEVVGVTTCRAEAESGEEWIIAGMVYTDRFVRRDGRWYLAERQHEMSYASDVLSRPASES
jgi:hypothetical protein